MLQRQSPDRRPDLQEHLHPKLGDVVGRRKRVQERYLQEALAVLLGQRLPDEA